MTQETESPTETLPTPAEVAEAPATEAIDPAAASPAEVATEAQSTPTEEVKSWHSVTDPTDLFDLEDVKPVLERRDMRVEQRLRADYEARLVGATKTWQSQEAHKQLAGIYGNILQRIEDGEIDATPKLIDRLETAYEPFKADYAETLRGEGANTMGVRMWNAMLATLDTKSRDKLEEVAFSPGKGWEDIMKSYADTAITEAVAPKDKKIAQLEATIEKMKATTRSTEGANLAPSQAGASSDLNKARRDYADGKISTAKARELGIV